MKRIKNICISLLLLLCCLSFTACGAEKPLDANVYFNEDVNFLKMGSDESGSVKLINVVNASMPQDQYTTIQINTLKDWTYGLTIEKICFDFVMSKVTELDFDITVSYLNKGTDYDKDKGMYFYKQSVTANKKVTRVELNINDIFTNNESTISIEISNRTVYENNPKLKVCIQNFKAYGKHEESKY